MKKIIAIIAALCALGIGAYAADINFTPEGGGKWIFCNNPEGLGNQHLMNSDDYDSVYIMNNENLEPDLYDFLICHINFTDTDSGYGEGYNIELDVEMTAVEDSVITVNKAFFETATDEAFIYSDGTWAKAMNKVGCLHGLSSMLEIPLAEMNGSWLYTPQEYEPVTLEIKKGETLWLSDYIDGYGPVGYAKPSQILAEVKIESGKMNMNVAAFKSGDEIGDRSGFDTEAKHGKYAYTRTQKGIADSLPKVNAYLEYTIDNSIKDGDYINNMVHNQYVPEGYLTDAWCSHLNPQDDIWSKKIAVECDLLPMTYIDDEKLTYYGSKVRDKDKNNVWIWDPYHSDTTTYQGDVTWYTADEYKPNYQLSEKRSNQGYAVSMGNYCVTESYNLKVKNTTNKDKYFEYVAETQSNIVVYTEDAENGKSSGILKGEKIPATKDTLASVKIPAGGEKEFSINVVLPINYVGGIKNSFKVCNESHLGKRYEDYINEPRAEKGPITTDTIASEVKDKLPQEVKDIIRGNYDCYELIKGNDGYMLRWILWDGCPYYYTNDWIKVKTIYYLDNNYNLVGKYDFDKLIRLALFYDGYYYVEDADGNRFKSADGQNWETYTKRMPLAEITFKNSKPSGWAKKEVERAYAIDVTPYQLKDKLVYDKAMTRETFCDVMTSMLELKDALPETVNMKFADTNNTNVSRLYGAGIISGYDDTTFGPKNSITREEAALILYNTAKYLGYNESDDTKYVYSDERDIGEWAREAVYKMNMAGIMTGVGGDKFAPKSTYTNEQSIATILRLYDET